MVLPPNRLGAIRGPNGSTLDNVVGVLADIYDRLGLIANSAAQSAAELGNINGAVQRLAGGITVPEGWTGLPNYLHTVIGTPTDAEEAETRLFGLLFTLSRITQAAAINTHGTDIGLLSPTLRSIILDTRNALITGQGENIFARLGSVRDNTLALLQATGSLPTTPEGQTVRALLAALVQCCEEGSPTNPANFQPPTELCVAGAPWQEATLALFTDPGPGNTAIWTVVWPDAYTAAPNATDLARNTVIGAQPSLTSSPQSGGPRDFTVCIAWKFAPTSTLVNMDATTTDNGSDVPNFAFTSYSGATPQEDSISASYRLLNASNVRQHLHANFGFDSGVAPAGKVWVAVSEPQ